jgi:hypothetical protein
MNRRYDAFLIRHWSLGEDGGQRVEIVHIQTGARTLVTSLAKAVDWLQARAATPGGDAGVAGPTPEVAGPDTGRCA